MLLFASSIVSSKSQLHHYTKDSRLLRTSHHLPQQPTSKNDNFQSAHYGNKEDDGQQSSYYFTPKKAITSSTQSQVNLFSSKFYFTIQSWFNVESVGQLNGNISKVYCGDPNANYPRGYPMNPPLFDLPDPTNRLLESLCEQMKWEYKNKDEFEFRRDPAGSDLRFFGLKAHAFLGLLSALRGPPGINNIFLFNQHSRFFFLRSTRPSWPSKWCGCYNHKCLHDLPTWPDRSTWRRLNCCWPTRPSWPSWQ